MYVYTADSECCIFTKQTLDSACAHNWQLSCMCTQHRVNVECAQNTTLILYCTQHTHIHDSRRIAYFVCNSTKKIRNLVSWISMVASLFYI